MRHYTNPTVVMVEMLANYIEIATGLEHNIIDITIKAMR